MKYLKIRTTFEPPVPAVIAGHSWISLPKGFFAKIDLEDYDRCKDYNWHRIGSSKKGHYVSARIDGKETYLHRFIMNCPPHLEVDHIYHDKFDNRKSNLRIVEKQKNDFNQGKRKGSSKYKGLTWYKRDQVWYARITFNYKSIHIGAFKDEREGALAYDKKHRELFGENLGTNEGLGLL